MARAKTKAPPLFGVTEVNDIYCDISRNIPRSEWLGITLPFTMVLVSLTALFILTPLIGYLQELIFLVPILLLLLYSGIHAVRLFIIKPKSLMVRLNRQEQKIYVQKHCINYNIFSQWPVETLVSTGMRLFTPVLETVPVLQVHEPGIPGISAHQLAQGSKLSSAMIIYLCFITPLAIPLTLKIRF